MVPCLEAQTGDTDHGVSDSDCQILLPRSALFQDRYLSMASPLEAPDRATILDVLKKSAMKGGIRMSTVSIIRTSAIFCAALFPVFAVTIANEGQTKTENAHPPDAPVASGEEMYRTYCAVCHALDGKGGGPATPALRDQVPDLTTLSQRHGGKYPARYVESVLRFGMAKGFPAHGNKDMPICCGNINCTT